MPLPPEQALTGTWPPGKLSLLGPVRRVAVLAVADHSSLEPDPVPAALPDEVAFRRFGSGPDLLLVAGERSTMTSWDPAVLVALAASYTVTIFDLPGSGFSSGGPALTPRGAADLTAGLIDSVGLSAPLVVGWGVGGEVALLLAERHPGLVGRLVLLDAVAGGAGAVRPAPQIFSALASPSLTAVTLASLWFPPSAVTARLAWLIETSRLAADDLVAAAVHDSAALTLRSWSDAGALAAAGSLRMPVLVVTGADDTVVPPANSARLAARLHAREIVLAGGGYAAYAQDSTSFVADLLRFSDLPAT